MDTDHLNDFPSIEEMKPIRSQLAYSILNPLTDGQDVPLTVSLSLMCELIDAADIPLSRKHAVIEQIKGQLDRHRG